MIIKNLLFDMDNTLYPETCLIDKNMTKRIITYVSEFLQLSYDDAAIARKDGLTRAGTTLEWLLTEHKLSNTKEYFEYLHPNSEKDEVDFDPKLRPFLQSLSEKYHLTVLTNAPKIHADCILNHLQIYDLFDGVYDLEDNNFIGKPNKNAYLKAIGEKGFTVEETLFFDDMPKYIKGYDDLGGKGILVDETGRFKDNEIAKKHAFATVRSVYDIPVLLKKIEDGSL